MSSTDLARCPNCGKRSLADLTDLPEMAQDEHYRFCPRCLAEAALAEPIDGSTNA